MRAGAAAAGMASLAAREAELWPVTAAPHPPYTYSHEH